MNIKIMMEKLNKLFSENRINEIEDFLSDNLRTAISENDDSAIMTILNELIGFYRDTSQYEKAISYCKTLEKLISSFGLENTIPCATTYLNIANVYRASGDYDKSFEFYRRTREIYDNLLSADDMLNASYNNNLSLLYQETGDFKKSCECLENALEIVKKYPDLSAELASTYANLSLSYLHLGDIENAQINAEKSIEIFERDEEKDFHYSSSLSAMADVMAVKKNYEKAIYYYEKALEELHKKVGFTQSYRRLMDNLETAYESMGKKNMLCGIFLARGYYETYGIKMLEEKFPEYIDKIAVGLAGEGSDCYGFDDKVSRDHDFGVGFCIWLDDETYEKKGMEFQKAYDELPEYFRGIPKLKKRRGIFKLSDFIRNLAGTNKFPEIAKEWLGINETGISAILNGEIFRDDSEIFTSIRRKFAQYYPDSIRNTMLSQYLAETSQNGQYNYARSMARGDIITAQLHLNAFADNVIKIVFILNRKFIPHRKQFMNMIRNFDILSDIEKDLQELFSKVPDIESWGKYEPEEWNGIINKEDFHVSVIERICSKIKSELRKQGFSYSDNNYLEYHAKEIFLMNDKEKYIDEIIDREWKMFDKVKNKGGRASCQDNFGTFSIMRKSQYMAWDIPILESYLDDLKNAEISGRNLITEKYARMMKYTVPDEYAEIEKNLPEMTERQTAIINQIAEIQVGWMEKFAEEYPKMAGNARSIHSYEDTENNTSYETYLKGELAVYSPETLSLYGKFIVSLHNEKKNLAEMIMTNTALLYGYKSLDDAESRL